MYSYWLDWLVLRDILKTACNIMNATYKGVDGWEGNGEDGGGGVWVNNALRHRRPNYVHSGPDRVTAALTIPEPSRRAIGQNWTPSYPINAPQGPHRVFYGPS